MSTLSYDELQDTYVAQLCNIEEKNHLDAELPDDRDQINTFALLMIATHLDLINGQLVRIRHKLEGTK